MWKSVVRRLFEIQNGSTGPKAIFIHAYSFNVKFSQNLQGRTKFYRTCPLVLQISESLVLVRVRKSGYLLIKDKLITPNQFKVATGGRC